VQKIKDGEIHPDPMRVTKVFYECESISPTGLSSSTEIERGHLPTRGMTDELRDIAALIEAFAADERKARVAMYTEPDDDRYRKLEYRAAEYVASAVSLGFGRGSGPWAVRTGLARAAAATARGRTPRQPAPTRRTRRGSCTR
jgi:hypothetical protein